MHNNETHLLMCTVPWSHMTMKWMTGFLLHGCYRPVCRMWRLAEQVKTVHMDELPSSGLTKVSQEFNGFHGGGGATDSDDAVTNSTLF